MEQKKEGWLMSIKKLVIVGLASTLLMACGNDAEESSEPETEENDGEFDDLDDEDSLIERPEESEEDLESWEEIMGDADIDLESDEEIPWEDIHLSEEQFDEFLESLLTDLESDSEWSISVEGYEFDEESIHIMIANNEEEEVAAEFSNTFFAIVTDTFVRQFYLNSDYYDGESQPLITIEDVNHGVVSELDDFVEMDEELEEE